MPFGSGTFTLKDPSPSQGMLPGAPTRAAELASDQRPGHGVAATTIDGGSRVQDQASTPPSCRPCPAAPINVSALTDARDLPPDRLTPGDRQPAALSGHDTLRLPVAPSDTGPGRPPQCPPLPAPGGRERVGVPVRGPSTGPRGASCRGRGRRRIEGTTSRRCPPKLSTRLGSGRQTGRAVKAATASTACRAADPARASGKPGPLPGGGATVREHDRGLKSAPRRWSQGTRWTM